MTRVWLHFDSVYNMTRYYKMEMEARRKSSLKFTDEILQRGRANSEVIYNHNGPKNTIKSLVNPKHGLDDEEIREEINSIIMAVSKLQIMRFTQQLITTKYFRVRRHQRLRFRRYF